jgi:DNA-binding response OmpR family regulator
VRAAVLTRSRFLVGAIANVSVHAGHPAARQFDSVVDVIRHMLLREAIDIVVVDADTHLDAIARLSAWRASQGRKDFAILAVGQMLRPEQMARALDLGSDDVVSGAFKTGEFVERAARCLARLDTSGNNDSRLELAGYILDRTTRSITLRDAPLQLRDHEFELSWLFFSNPGVLISRPRIATEIWHKSAAEIGSGLGKQIHRLRGKLKIEREGPIALRAVYSSGYRLEISDDNADEGSVKALPAASQHFGQ